MKTSRLLCAAIILVPGVALAASAFDGTWKTDTSRIQASTKPFVTVIDDTGYTCSSCTPPYTVKADGTDQKVTGHDYDTVAVTVTPTSVTVVRKLKGKPLASVKEVIGSDGKTATQEGTYNYGAEPATNKVALKQVTPPAAGANPLSGSWVVAKVLSVSDTGATETLAMTDDGFSWSSNGQSYDAKFDGKPVAITGDPTHTKVKVKKLAPTSVLESDYDKGKLVETTRRTVSADGKTVHVVDTDVRSGRINKWTMDKQP
jgi:hypothetical protein